MKNTAALPRPELLQVAEAVARDKGIEKDEVLTAMEAAIQKAGRSKYGTDVYVRIDRKTGEILAEAGDEITEAMQESFKKFKIKEFSVAGMAAQQSYADAVIGRVVTGDDFVVQVEEVMTGCVEKANSCSRSGVLHAAV